MTEEQRWTREEFEAYILGHSLLRPMAQAILWVGCDAMNKVVTTFRVAEDDTFSDIQDNTITLTDEVVWIGVLHPISLTVAECAQWGELLMDYQLIAPFPQLTHPVFTPTPEECQTNMVTRYTQTRPDGTRWAYVLPYLGWKSIPERGYRKSYPAYNIIAVVGRERGDYTNPTAIHEVFFVRDLSDLKDKSTALHSKDMPSLVPLAEVPPFVFSEALTNVERLLSKDTRNIEE